MIFFKPTNHWKIDYRKQVERFYLYNKCIGLLFTVCLWGNIELYLWMHIFTDNSLKYI